MLAAVQELSRETMDERARAAHDDARQPLPADEVFGEGLADRSGSVESACKNVVNQRLSMGGMRWGEAGVVPK